MWTKEKNKIYQREWRAKNKEKIKEYQEKWRTKDAMRAERRQADHERRKVVNPERHRAQQAVSSALWNGKLQKSPFCQLCLGSKYIQAHHPDYSQKLEVVWLCRPCHQDVHRHF